MNTVNTVESFRFLGTILSQDLKWELNISSLTKKAQQRMYFLRQLKKFNLTMMVHFYVHPHLLHHHLVRCCHCQGQEQAAAYHLYCGEGDWLQSAYP